MLQNNLMGKLPATDRKEHGTKNGCPDDNDRIKGRLR
jgi:hypothetical protein